MRIPASVMNEARLSVDQPVDVREENGRIVVEPVRSPEHALDELLAGITPENLHEPIDFGPPVGKETW